jgi:hypothetical protein
VAREPRSNGRRFRYDRNDPIRPVRLPAAASFFRGRLLFDSLLAYAHYNLCHVVKTLRVTPAVAAGVTNHVWDIQEFYVS